MAALIGWRLVRLVATRRSGRAGAKLHVRLVTWFSVFFFDAENVIRVHCVTGVQTCALPISIATRRAYHFRVRVVKRRTLVVGGLAVRSEEHTSELQSHSDLVCRLLLEK